MVESLIVLSQGSFQDPAVSVLMSATDENWPVNSAFYALWTIGWTEPLIGLRYSELIHGSARVGDLVRRLGYIAGAGSDEYRENRRSVSVPVLILAGRPRTERWTRDRETIAEEARGAASEYKLPTLKLVEDSLIMPGHTETRRHALVEAIVSFARSPERTEPSESALDAAPSPFHSIMFTDLEASTALTQRLGDEGAQRLLREHDDAVREALGDHGGREVKHTGDGIMASFPSAVAAVASALQIQRDLEGAEVRVRVGLNAGEPIAEHDDLFGTAVQMAARITDRADPGQVLVSRVVADLCAGKSYKFSSVGVATMKGFDEPVELFEVGY
jgi:class 3 adenylate cyclase